MTFTYGGGPVRLEPGATGVNIGLGMNVIDMECYATLRQWSQYCKTFFAEINV